MTYTNLKTILFAGLIAAMILPFSGMDFAEAEKSDTIDAKKLRAQIDGELKTEKDPKIKERYGLIKQLVNIKESIQNSNDDSKIDKLNAKAYKIMEKLNDSYANDEQTIATPVETFAIKQVSSGNDVSFSAQQHRQPDCYNPNHSYGWQDGDGHATSSGTTIKVSNTSYPTAVGTGVIGNCDTHYDDWMTSALSGPYGTCLVFVNPGVSYNADCTIIKANQIVIVTTQATYGWFSENFASQGWTIMSTF